MPTFDRGGSLLSSRLAIRASSLSEQPVSFIGLKFPPFRRKGGCRIPKTLIPRSGPERSDTNSTEASRVRSGRIAQPSISFLRAVDSRS